jgi:DNA polymerase I-like protein with 3'-5' exonuclease and polymerase domains
LSQFARSCKSLLRDTARPLLFIHDAIVLEVRESALEEVAAKVKWCMENPPLKQMFGIELAVPLKSDAEWGEHDLSSMSGLSVAAERPAGL